MAHTDRSPAHAPRLPASIDRADVAAILERCREAMATSANPEIDCEEVVDPKLPTVEVIARLALAAQRSRHALRLEHASPALLELLALCGLTLRAGPDGDDPGST